MKEKNQLVVDAREQFAKRTVDWIRKSNLTQEQLKARLRQMPREFNEEVTKVAAKIKEKGNDK